MPDEGGDLFSNQDTEQSDERDDGRRRRSNAEKGVDDAGQQADREREKIRLHVDSWDFGYTPRQATFRAEVMKTPCLPSNSEEDIYRRNRPCVEVLTDLWG
jgi:hypothetical protein